MKHSILLALFLFSLSAQAEFSAIFEQEWAIDDGGNGQKFETTFEPEWNLNLTDNIDMTFIARARFDALNNLGPKEERPDNYSSINGPLVQGSHGELSVREWFIDTEINETYWRIGKQQVVWGQSDGLKVLDVINPQSYREFVLDDFDSSRIPLWMLNVEIPITEDDSLQLLWVPDLTYNELAEAGSPYQMTSSLLVPQIPPSFSIASFEVHKPEKTLKDSDIGLRYSKFYSGWDLTFNYFYHYQDNPALYQNVEANQVSIDAEYKRNHLVGATASKAFGDFTLRTEVGYNSDTYHLIDNRSPIFLAQQGVHHSDELSSVIGLDWQGLEDTLLSVQWFQSYLLDYDPTLIRPEQNHIVSFLYKQTFENETWEIEALALHGFDQKDGSIQIKLSYMLESNIKLWLGSDIFYGDGSGLLGQFDNTDRITLGFEWGF